MHDALRWWRSRSVLLRDAIGTVAFAAVAFLPALAPEGVEFGEVHARSGGVLALVLALAQVLPLALRRRSPATCLAVTGIAFAACQCLGYPGSFTSEGLPLALYAAGAHQPRRRRALAAAVTVAYAGTCVTLAALHSAESSAQYVTFYLALASIWVAGALIRSRQRGEAERRRRAAGQAVAAERARIARELHDVVTHHVTAMVVRADAAQFLPPAQAGRVTGELGEIATAGRRALAELRYMLNLLDTASPDEQPTFAAGRIGDLIEQARQAGQPVELTEQGQPVPLTDAAQLAAYRVVQESLTNALKHAPGQPVAARVSYGEAGVEIEVTTGGPAIDAASFTPGRGLTGLRERVAQCRGTLEAAPRPGGGFRMHAQIPAAASRAAGPGRATGRAASRGAGSLAVTGERAGG